MTNVTLSSDSNQQRVSNLSVNIQGVFFAALGLAFSAYNTKRVVSAMFQSPPDQDFAATMLFFTMGMIPIVISLYVLAAIKGALTDSLGAKTILIMSGVLMFFLLLLWAVLTASNANVKSTMIGFILPMLLRASSQSPGTTVNDANQRVLCYFGGMIIGIGLNALLIKGGYIDAGAYSFEQGTLLENIGSRGRGEMRSSALIRRPELLS